MKKFLSVLKCIGCVFTGVIALVFTFVEIRPIFAGDFLLMESPALGFIKYFFRAIIFLLVILNTVKVFYYVLKKRGLDQYGLIFNGAVIIATLFAFGFYEWYIAALIILLNVVVLIIRIFNAPIELSGKPKEEQAKE